MAKRRRVRGTKKWPEGTEHFVIFTGDCLPEKFVGDEYTASVRREFQDGVALEKADTKAGLYLDLPRTVMIVHAMPKKS